MGILIPTQTLTGPQNPLVAAATGLFEGLSQGIPIAEQMQRRKEESQRQNTEMAMLQAAQQRKFGREDASKRAAQALLQASMMNAGAPPNGLGGQSPPGASAGSGAPALSGFQTVHPGAAPGDLADLGQEQGPGTGGSPLQGPPEQGPTGQETGYSGGHPPTGNPGTDWLFNEMHSGSLKDISVEEAEKISEAHARDLHLQAVTQHAGRLSNTIQRGLDKGAYDAVDEDGHPDPSATIEMQNIQQRIQSLDRTDPRAAAALLDQAEQAEAAARQYKAHAEAGFARRQRMDMGFQTDIQNRMAQPRAPGQPDVASDEMSSLYSMWKNHLIPDEKMAAAWNDASNGQFALKQQLAQMQMRNAQLENAFKTAQITAERNKAEQGTPEGLEAESQRKTRQGVAIANARKAANGPLGEGRAMSADRQYKAAHEMAEKDFQVQQQNLANDQDALEEFNKTHDEFVSQREEEHLRRMRTKPAVAGESQGGATSNGTIEEQPAGPTGPASVLWRLFKKGKIGKDELKRRAEKAGLTPDDFKAFTGAK